MSESSEGHEELENLNSLINNYSINKKSTGSTSQRSAEEGSASATRTQTAQAGLLAEPRQHAPRTVTKKKISLYRKKPKSKSTSSIENKSGSESSDHEDNRNNLETKQNLHHDLESDLETDSSNPNPNFNIFQSDPAPFKPKSNPTQNEEESSDLESELSIDLPSELPKYPQQNPQQQQQSRQQQQQQQQTPQQNLNYPEILPSQEIRVNHAQQGQFPQIPPQQQQQQAHQYRVVRKSVPGQSYGITPLTVVTFNVWYNKKDLVTRTKRLIKTILNGHKYLPDLICLQEVTPKSYQIIQHHLARHYHLFEIFGDPPLPYSNLIAIKRETMDLADSDLTSYDFDSQMGRKLMVCQVQVKETGIKFYVLNTHLESLEANWKYRRNQMESIYRLIKGEKYHNFILAGDFNICHDTEPIETQLRLYDYHDAWKEMGTPQSLKNTYDSFKNPYADKTHRGEPKYRSRLDRILYRFKDDKIVITKLKLLGAKEPFLSDHFGVLAEFMLKSN